MMIIHCFCRKPSKGATSVPLGDAKETAKVPPSLPL